MFSIVQIQTDMAVPVSTIQGYRAKLTAPRTTLTLADGLQDELLYHRGNSPQYPPNRRLLVGGVQLVLTFWKDALHPPEIKFYTTQPTS